jgi:FAD/FMN-containing dehydrogenase
MNLPEPGFGEIACGAQLYTYQWGHFVIAEFIFAYDHTNPEHCQAVWDCMHNMGGVPWMMGTGPWTLGRDPFVPNLTGNFYDVAKKLKMELDPKNIMNPGIAFTD